MNHLDNFSNLFGIARMIDESDDSLRYRLKLIARRPGMHGSMQRLLYLLARLKVSRRARNYLPIGVDA